MEHKVNQNSSHYFERVYDVTRLVPVGRVTTYGAIADFLALGSARMVGWALNQCHQMDDLIPAHRVVNRLGELSGRLHFKTPTTMENRLKSEGIIVENDVVQNFKEVFWHPRELDKL
ncbi:MAG: MGMT family protein [Saprospiraceae bacterium]|nr:MGMT family protein [Saprospiraceae bacterium]MCB9308458.1 MGMT family protein [Lewinellaceae bacterium]